MPTTFVTVHTHRDERIYASAGGGQDRVVATFPRSQGGLIRAAHECRRLRRQEQAGFGTIGAGVQYVEIDGERLHRTDEDILSGSSGWTLAEMREHADAIIASDYDPDAYAPPPYEIDETETAAS